MTVNIVDSRITLRNSQPEIHPYLEGLSSHVGNTPLLPLRKITTRLSPKVQIYAKAEWFNPSGSIKDRPALNIIRNAIASGQFRIGMRLLDATSGNMGIAYATFGPAMGVPVTLTIPENASSERLKILQSLGAQLILTDALEGTDGASLEAARLYRSNPELYFYANQYDNPANWQAHYMSTGPEIVHQTGGSITHFLAGLGTSGTMTGTGRFLKQFDAHIQLVAVQPDSPLHGIEGVKHMSSAIQPAIYDPTIHDRTIEVSTEEAREMVRRLAREEGLFVGVSAGANAVAAIKLAAESDEGLIVTVFPDAGYKYLSDRDLWE